MNTGTFRTTGTIVEDAVDMLLALHDLGEPISTTREPQKTTVVHAEKTAIDRMEKSFSPRPSNRSKE